MHVKSPSKSMPYTTSLLLITYATMVHIECRKYEAPYTPLVRLKPKQNPIAGTLESVDYHKL